MVTKTRITAAEYVANFPETTQPMELIEGEPITLPTPSAIHQSVIGKLYRLISTWLEKNPRGHIWLSPLDVHFSQDTVLQPDLFFVVQDCHMGEDGYFHGVPDLCIEVLSPSSVKRDRIQKFDLYERFGVREYWLVDPGLSCIEVYALQGGIFQKYGVYESTNLLSSSMLDGLQFLTADAF